MFLLASCAGKKEEIDWSVTLDRESKNPYGSYIAYKLLKLHYPNTKAEALSGQFRFTSITDEMVYDEPSLMVLNGLSFQISDEELWRLWSYIYEGNNVLLYASSIDQDLLSYLGMKANGGGEEYPPGSGFAPSRRPLTFAHDEDRVYSYKGRTIYGYFEGEETDDDSGNTNDKTVSIGQDTFHNYVVSEDEMETYTQEEAIAVEEYEDEEETPFADSLSMNGYVGDNANFVTYHIGKGKLLVHAAPLTNSNYFLLQEGNREYMENVLQYVPPVSHIYWVDYYKRRTEKSSLGILWQHPATKWAFIIALIALAVYVLFESKRRQRMIPIHTTPENTSVSFAETVGRLYYNKGNHQNLAWKMAQHFLEWVRSHYYLDSNHVNEKFVKKLTQKSGMSESHVRELADMINDVRSGNAYTDDAFLYRMHYLIHSFYKK